MQAQLTIAFVGVADNELSHLFYHIRQQDFAGDLVNYLTPFELLNTVNHSPQGPVPALVVLYYRETAVLAPDHLRLLRTCRALAHVPVVVYARTIAPETDKALDDLEAYAAIPKPKVEGGWPEHAAAFIHMCHFWYHQYPEYSTLLRHQVGTSPGNL